MTLGSNASTPVDHVVSVLFCSFASYLAILVVISIATHWFGIAIVPITIIYVVLQVGNRVWMRAGRCNQIVVFCLHAPDAVPSALHHCWTTSQPTLLACYLSPGKSGFMPPLRCHWRAMSTQ